MSNENIDPKALANGKKRKRISFSKNLMLQELLSDGSTRVFEEKINDHENCSLVSMEIEDLDQDQDSDSIFNKTVYDTYDMEFSLMSPTASPTPLQQISPPSSQSRYENLTPQSMLCNQTTTLVNELPDSQQSLKSSQPLKQPSPIKSPVSSPLVPTLSLSVPLASPLAPALSLSAPIASPSFSLPPSLIPSSPSQSLDQSVSRQDIGDTCHDSVLAYIDEKSDCQLRSISQSVNHQETTLDDKKARQTPEPKEQQISPQFKQKATESFSKAPLMPSTSFSMQPLSPLFSPLLSLSVAPKDIIDASPLLQQTPLKLHELTPKSSFSKRPLSTSPLLSNSDMLRSTMPLDVIDSLPQNEETLKEQTPHRTLNRTKQQTPKSPFSKRPLSTSPLLSNSDMLRSTMPLNVIDSFPRNEETLKEQTPQRALNQTTQQTPTSSFSPQALSLVAQSPSPSFSMRQSTTPLSPSLSPSAIQQDIGDTFYDSVLVYIDEKSELQLSGDDSTPEQSIDQYHRSTTFAADLLDGDSIEAGEEDSDDNLLDFIDNRAPSPVRKMLNSASVDSRLWSSIEEINEEYSLLTFMRGNFKVLLKFDLNDEDKLEVVINEISCQSFIDQNIKEKGQTRIHDSVYHSLTKPRDAKLIKVIKNFAKVRLEQYKMNIETPAMLNDVIKGICKIFNRLEALTLELAELTWRHEWKITNADINSFEIALETHGLRYTLWLVLCLDLTTYSDNACKVKFGVHKADLKLYPYPLMHRAVKNVLPGDSDYLRCIVRAIKKCICDYRLNHSRKSIRYSVCHKRSIMCTNDN